MPASETDEHPRDSRNACNSILLRGQPSDRMLSSYLAPPGVQVHTFENWFCKSRLPEKPCRQ
jgi:hypothetical protein